MCVYYACRGFISAYRSLLARVSSEWLVSPQSFLEAMCLLQHDEKCIRPLQVCVPFAVQPHHMDLGRCLVSTPDHVGFLSSEFLFWM